MMPYKTVKDATYAWMKDFSVIPRAICEKLLKNDENELWEVTPPQKGDRVYFWFGSYEDRTGVIVGFDDEEEIYVVELDNGEKVEVEKDTFEISRDYILPMWGTLWAFGNPLDNDWIKAGGLQKMAECGFRVYEQEDYGYIFGIDGAGYDFIYEHWIPLYKARGFQWHETDLYVA